MSFGNTASGFEALKQNCNSPRQLSIVPHEFIGWIVFNLNIGFGTPALDDLGAGRRQQRILRHGYCSAVN